MKRLLLPELSFVILLLLVGCANQPMNAVNSHERDTSHRIAWGEDVNGLMAGISMLGISKEHKMGIKLVLYIHNTIDRPIKLLKLSSEALFWGEYLPIEVRVDDTLINYQGMVLLPPEPPGESDYINLQPGDTDLVEVLLRLENWKLEPPVEVKLVFVFINISKTSIAYPYYPQEKKWTEVRDLWIGKVRSGVIRVSIGS
jgi:hypothetical protein